MTVIVKRNDNMVILYNPIRVNQRQQVMKINILIPGVEISEGLLHLIRSKFSRLERNLSGIIDCGISLSRVSDSQHHTYAMEANITTPKATFFDRQRAGSFEEALAQLVDNLSTQLKKHSAELTASPRS
jgi:ribosomal subunit interface protein